MKIQSLKYTFLYNLIFPFVEIIHAFNWYKTGKSATPHFIKKRIVEQYQKKYKTQIFIETGTYLGIMVNSIKGSFKKIYTIELDAALYRLAQKKFKNFRHIELILGDSATVIPKLLKTIHTPCLFWLDANYSGGFTTKKKGENTPILDELSAIFNHKIKNHVILIDDANIFIGKNDYPTIHYIEEFTSRKNHNVTVKDNIIIIC